MPAFMCPECGHKSTYRRREPAYCPRCGYVPSPEGSKSLRDLFSALGLRLKAETLPVTQIVQMYTFMKEQNPDKIILIRQEDALYAFGDDARIVAQVCGSNFLADLTFKGLESPTAKMEFAGHHQYVAPLSKAGHEVVIVDPARWKPLTAFKPARRPSPMPPQRSTQPSFVLFACPACGYRSTYDPWAESAHCPRCGYTPSPRNVKRDPKQPPSITETRGMITLFCPQCKLQIPYNVSDPSTSCPWCGYALPLLSQKTIFGSRQLLHTKGARQSIADQTEIDRRRLVAFMAHLLAWGMLAALALLAIYLIFLPAIPLLFGVGLILLIIGLRNVKTRRGSVSIRYVTAAPAHVFDVQGWQAVVLGLFRVLLGLGLMLFSSLPRVVELWGHLQRIFSWLPSA
jgi:ribosomal protein S27E